MAYLRPGCCCLVLAATLGCDGLGAGEVPTADQASNDLGGAATTLELGVVPLPHGGSRLKARIAEAGSGASEFLGWYDTNLDTECDFTRVPSGSVLCLPSDRDGVSLTNPSEPPSLAPPSFADPQCSLPVQEIRGDGSVRCDTPRFVSVVSQGCSVDPQYFRVGEKAATVYRVEDDSCRAVELPAQTTEYSLGYYQIEPFASDGFVAGTVSQGGERAGVLPVQLSASDGAQQFWSFHDADEGFECELEYTVAGLRCLPHDLPMVGFGFADPECEEPAAVSFSCGHEVLQSIPFAVDVASQGGGESSSQWHIFEGGTRLPTIYGAGAACSSPGGVGGSAFAVGAEIPSGHFVAGSEDRDVDERGLIAVVEHVGGWTLSGSQPLQGAELGGYNCAYLSTRDGVVRCVPPPERYAEIGYSDPECRYPVAAGYNPFLTVVEEAQCPISVRVFERGEGYTGSVYVLENGECTFSFEQGGGRRVPLYRFENEVPAQRFPAIEVVQR